ncbi:MAG: polyphenol oxidase family protein, partial [Bdellovibrionales bacterium]|nr:polyphenol oxidase family protein [Bdellovibrionales bacterium]
MEITTTDLGISVHNDNYFVFFGNKELCEENLINVTQQLPIQFMQQTHSNKILEFTSFQDYSCDGLTTTQKNVFLAIRTADCLPIVLIHDQRIFAIHAGWRGLVNSILQATKSYSQFNHKTMAFIGPHIAWKSFEVGLEVVDQAQRALTTMQINFDHKKLTNAHQNPNKAYLNLSYLAELQLSSLQ